MTDGSKRRIDTGMVVAVSALVVSVCAVVLSFNEVRLVRSQTEASVWPHVQWGVNVNFTSDGDSFVFRFVNSGVGPARIRSLQVFLDDEPVQTWTEVVEIFTGSPDVAVRNTVNGNVLPAGEEIRAFGDFDRERIDVIAQEWGRLDVALCYCSVLDDCWRVDGREAGQDGRPEPVRVDECVTDPELEFWQ
jgi:hypothetical protein